jgi:multidrug efflux pump subunit AcrA (membrane-fusion protein)
MKTKALLIFTLLSTGILGCRDRFRDGDSSFTGILEMTEYSLGSRVPGRVVTLNVTDGDAVKKDQLLATLDHYEQTKRDYDRTVKLLSSGGATQQALEKAKLDLDDQQIVSPDDRLPQGGGGYRVGRQPHVQHLEPRRGRPQLPLP